MTFAELLEEVMENVRGSPAAEQSQRGEIKRLMNLAQRDISVKTGLPQVYIDVPAQGFVTGRFSLGAEYHPEGVKYAEVVEVADGAEHIGGGWMRNREIAILSAAEANMSHSRWEDDDYVGAPFLLYNPLQQNEGFLPVGIGSARYRFLVQAVPAPMVNDSDEPFATMSHHTDPPTRSIGVMPAHHRILAHHVSYELLQRHGDQRWQAFYARYRQLEEMIFSHGVQAEVHLPQFRSSRRVRRYA